MAKTPKKRAPEPPIDEDCLFTPPMKQNLRAELKEALMKRNALTAKSQSKVIAILDDMGSSPDTTLTKPSELRRMAIEEIITSEKRYLQQLEILIEYFINPVKDQKLIDIKTHTALFGQVEMIYNLNKELLNELENDLDNVSKAFLRLAPFFKLYSVYAFDYKSSLLLLQDLSTKNQVFKKFIDDTETRPEVQMKLNSLMITPIQRVPRYKLLLQQVQLYTSPSEPDHKNLNESIKEIENTVQHINSVVEDQEHTQSMINLQNSLVHRSPSIVKPSRRIIKEGVLSRMLPSGAQQKYYCVLMSDIFMYCKALKKRSRNTVVENSLQCCCIYPLRKSKVSEMFSANFKLSCQGDGIIFHADTDQECRAWVSDMKEVINVMVEHRKTLRKESSRKRPVKKRQLKYFEAEYILSPAQKGNKYDYENIYKCDVTPIEKRSSLNLMRLKRAPIRPKQSNLNDDQQTMRRSSTPTREVPAVFKPPSPKQSRFSKLKKWFSFSNTLSSPVTSNSSTDFDPTYGFASRISNQTYFKPNNLDSTIPMGLDFKTTIAGMGVQLDITPTESSSLSSSANIESQNNSKDMLFPLRQVLNNSNQNQTNVLFSSGKKRKQAEISSSTDETIMSSTSSDDNGVAIQRKRVKFDEQTHVATDSFFESRRIEHLKEQQPHYHVPQFKPLPSNGHLSLRDKIVDFFSKLI